MADTKKLAEELRAICRENVSDEFLASALEELTESTDIDTPAAQAVVEELVTKYHCDKNKLMMFAKKVAAKPHVDEDEVLKETEHEEEDWAEAEDSESEEFTRSVPERDGVR